MPEFSDVHNLRRRYIIALSAIALLVTGSWFAIHTIVDHQRNYSRLISLAGRQNGLAERIAQFSTQMVITKDAEEFTVAKAQLGRAISLMESTHRILLNGDLQNGVPLVKTPTLDMIYFDPTVGLDKAIARYLNHARTVYRMPKSVLKANSGSYVFLMQYGPHVLDAMFTAATDEYDQVSRQAIQRIERLETALWLATLVILLLEAFFIFRPLEVNLRQSLTHLTERNADLIWNLQDVRSARLEAEKARDQLNLLNRHLEERINMRTRELTRELNRHELTEARLRKSKHKVEAANHAKSEFLANMSHELRTPLNAIIGFSNMLRTEVFGPLTNDKQREYVNDILSSGEHLLELINDILDVSALEAHKLKLNIAVFSLTDTIDAVWRMVHARAQTKNVTLHKNISVDLRLIRADERRVTQILLNLMTNAIKFTPSGGDVVLEAKTGEANSILLCVRDTGIGMSEEDVVTAFTQFGQIDSTFSRVEEGTGLGLPLTKGLIELHGGHITLESKKGQGTSVTVHFPAKCSVQKVAPTHPADSPYATVWPL